MNVRFLIAWLALGLLAAGGCVGPNVLTDFDPSAEFSAFRTFAFAGLGASHQTGWTGLVAKTIQVYGFMDAKRFLEVGKRATFKESALLNGAAGARGK